jgi:glutaminase
VPAAPTSGVEQTEPTCPIARTLARVYAEIASSPIEGAIADYIPELSKADPAWFGMVLVTADGHVYAVGDADVPFTIQSISKPFVYGMVLEAWGLDATLAKVGVEPSGEAFNSISLYPETGRPFNPMINAGAITCAGLLHEAHGGRTVERVVRGFGKLAGRPLSIDEAVFESERATGHRNRAIGHLLRNFDILPDDVNEPLHAYFAQCSIRVTCRDLAMMGATLANRGVNPSTGQRALAPEHVHRVLSVMSSCGMYDYSGEWGYRVGLPAKSGVGGGVLAVLPGQLAIAVFSPPLDARGNSVRGIRACEELGRRFQLHLLSTPRVGAGVIRSDDTARTLRSRRSLRPEQNEALAKHGNEIRVLQAQGDLSFAAIETITHALMLRFDETRYAVLDLHRVTRIDATATGQLLALLDGFERAGKTLVFSRCHHLKPFVETMLAQRDSERLAIADDPLDALELCEDELLAALAIASGVDQEVPLAQQPLMRGVAEAELASLQKQMTRRNFEAGELIVREGEPASHVYFLTQGRASVVVGDPFKPTAVVARVYAGVCVGEMAMVDRQPRSASVRADSETVCHELPFAALETSALAAVRSQMVANLALDLAQRLRQRNAEIWNLT